ncbi:hypothetical protein EDD22DRAFT_84460 [Suillus occidentalis]|nr:hypothetical protein EDD22DRAFT_84460 [Suillus occidentalis]
MEVEFSVHSRVENEYEVNSLQKAHSGQKCGDVPTSFKLPASTRCMTIIPELRWKIFQLVHDAPADSMGNRTLLALALTCKSFSGPALDLLWQDLDNFSPLVKCLPQGLCKWTGYKFEFQRTMTFDDWSIFCKYNHRVRSLRTNRHPVADTEFWRNLSCPPFLPPLLPNLVSLMWKSDNTELFSYMWLFATPKLRRLDILTKTFDPSEHSVLSLISMLCPSISHFNFHSIMNSADTSTALQRWSHLTSVITREVSEAALLHLFKLPSLHVLEFHLPPTPMSANTKKLLQCSYALRIARTNRIMQQSGAHTCVSRGPLHRSKINILPYHRWSSIRP